MIDERKLLEKINDYCSEFDESLEENKSFDGYNIKSICMSVIAEILDLIQEQPKVGKWISVEERLPEEHDSMFAKLKGTDKWLSGMFEKKSDEVIVTCEYEDGTIVTKTSKTVDGEWVIEKESIFKLKVLFWRPLPEPYREPLEKTRKEKQND